MIKKLITLLLLSPLVYAGLILSPLHAFKLNFGEDAIVTKKTILISRAQAKEVQKIAKLKLSTKLYKTYTVSKNGTVLAYGIIVLQRVRTKNDAVLLIITLDGILRNVEIIAFNEANEWLPSKRWVDNFRDHNIVLNKDLKLGRNIPNVTGSTFSVRSVTDATRIGLAIYEVVMKK